MKIARKKGNIYPGFAHRARDRDRRLSAFIVAIKFRFKQHKFRAGRGRGRGRRTGKGLACGSAIKSSSFNRNKLTVR